MRKSYINKIVKGIAVGAAVMCLSCAMPVSVYATENDGIEVQQDGVTPFEGTYYVSTEMGLNVRDNPSTSSNKLGLLDYGQAVSVKGLTQDGWFVIDYNGATGYIASKYMSDTPVAAKQEDTPEVPEAPAEESQQEAAEDTTEQTTQRETETEISGLEVMSTGTKALLIVVVLALFGAIGYTAYSIFKNNEEDDEYEYYEGEEYDDEEYVEDYSDDAYYEEEYADDNYYGDEYEGEYSDDNYSDNEYYEDDYVDDNYSDNQYHNNRYSNTNYSNTQRTGRPQSNNQQTRNASPKSQYFGNNTANNTGNFGNNNPGNRR